MNYLTCVNVVFAGENLHTGKQVELFEQIKMLGINKYILTASLIVLLTRCDNGNGQDPVDDTLQTTEAIQVDGRDRSYIQYLPEGWETATNMPIIFILHGGNIGNPENMLENVDFREIANAEKIILIYPAGIQNNWNDGRPTDANLLGVDDVNFISTLIDKLASEFSIDLGAVFATGVSNGGFMSSRLGCELSNKIAAIAAVAATIEETTIFPNCSPINPVSAMYIHGTLDKFVPIVGGEMPFGDGGFVVSHTDAIDKWVEINNTSNTPIVTNLPDIADDGTTIIESKYQNGANSSEVVGYVIENGGHTWPQGTGPEFPLLVGIRSKDMNAKQVIWDFFKNHKRN